MPLTTYRQLLASYKQQQDALQNKLGWLGLSRLLAFAAAVVFGFIHFNATGPYWLIASIASLALFFYFVRLYQEAKDKSSLVQALIEINEKEINIVDGNRSTYPPGSEFVDSHHPYSYDLDIFGEGSLFGFLNRTTTSFGKQSLARLLLHPEVNVIEERQSAVRDLTGKIELRQRIQAFGTLQEIKADDMKKLESWIALPPPFKTPLSYFAVLIFPLATLASLVFYFSTGADGALRVFSGLFILNFFITALYLKKIMKQVAVSTAVSKVLEQFSNQLREMEPVSFESSLLTGLQSQLRNENGQASRNIRRLASLFKYLDFVINPVMSTILNGLCLFHLHVLFSLDQWKRKNSGDIMKWLRTVGELESLNCLANLAFNNPGYCYPEITKEETLEAESLAHPLIGKEKNVSNDVSFRKERFIVLTGSNMSGKSTFLRTIGINIVLARAGAVVNARKFRLYPFDLHVSMRISDSLQDSESFFYAELKRLKEIIEHLEKKNQTFVMLDEILRGTNSNDKHSGTVGLIRKLVEHRACGIIATHDLSVAELSREYSGYLSNKCFESEIVNGELQFDYKLKDGVCTRLNASYLMKKMGVID